jgi:LPS export ABC transporter protein LptC
MFASTGLAAVTIQADSGALETDTQRLTALGAVIANTRSGAVTVRTTELVFDPSTGRLTSDSATVVERGGSTERGPCFEGNALLTEWSLCSGSP